MNLENIKKLIKNKKIEDAIMKILEFEQSKLHQCTPQYKLKYYEIIQESLKSDNK